MVANFEKAAYNVMFTISGQGSVQKEVVGGGGFTHGSQVKLTATPSDNYSFFTGIMTQVILKIQRQ